MQGIVPSQFFAGSSADVGVIGGADGPTAIFVTSAFPSLLGALLYAPASLACALIACYFLARSPLCWRGALRLDVYKRQDVPCFPNLLSVRLVSACLYCETGDRVQALQEVERMSLEAENWAGASGQTPHCRYTLHLSLIHICISMRISAA